MLTRITIITGVITAALNLAVLFGVDLSTDQLAGVNALIVAVGGAIHAWFNPDVPVGVQADAPTG